MASSSRRVAVSWYSKERAVEHYITYSVLCSTQLPISWRSLIVRCGSLQQPIIFMQTLFHNLDVPFIAFLLTLLKQELVNYSFQSKRLIFILVNFVDFFVKNTEIFENFQVLFIKFELIQNFPHRHTHTQKSFCRISMGWSCSF